jgi:hypothetical protein
MYKYLEVADVQLPQGKPHALRKMHSSNIYKFVAYNSAQCQAAAVAARVSEM